MARDPRRFRLRGTQYPWQSPGHRDEELIRQKDNDFLREIEKNKLEISEINLDGAVSGDILVASGNVDGDVVFVPQKWVPKLGVGLTVDPTWALDVSGGSLHWFLRDTTFGGFQGIWLDKEVSLAQRVGLRLASGGTAQWEVSHSSGGFFLRSAPNSLNVVTLTSGGVVSVSGQAVIDASGSAPLTIKSSNVTKIGVDVSGEITLTDINAGHTTGANGILITTSSPGLGAGIRYRNGDVGAANPWQAYNKGGSGDFVIGRENLRDNILFPPSQPGVYIPTDNTGTFAPAGSYCLYVGPTSGAYQIDLSGNVKVGATLAVTGTVVVTGATTLNGRVFLPSGSQSLPPYTFIDDPDTGFYNSSPDMVSVTTGGTIRTVFSSTGLLQHLYDFIAGGFVRADGGLVSNRVTGNSGLDLTGTGTGAQTWTFTPSTSQSLVLQRPGLRLMMWDNDGNTAIGAMSSDLGAAAPLYFRAADGYVGFGIQSPSARIHVIHTDSGTSDVSGAVFIGRNSTGTPAAGFGTEIRFQLESATTERQDAAGIRVGWQTATHDSRAASGAIDAYYTTTARECINWAADSSAARVGFLGAAHQARPSAYTQTYSTADRTHAARTAAALTDNVSGTITTTLAAIPDPADTPADADALREDLVANILPVIRNIVSSLADQVNKGRVDALDTSQLANVVLDDLQAFGLLG